MRLHGTVPGGGVTSENWSGYAVTGSSFTFAKGSWHVPEVDCSKTPNTYSAFWEGIDGYSDKTVEQTGTASDCDGTTAQYYAWYEFYPAGSVPISMPIEAGDVRGASVTYSDGKFTVSIHNHTTGQNSVKPWESPEPNGHLPNGSQRRPATQAEKSCHSPISSGQVSAKTVHPTLEPTTRQTVRYPMGPSSILGVTITRSRW